MLDLRERDDYNLQIVFVRHGESLGNLGLETPDGFHKDDTPLSPEGHRQAELLAGGFEKGEIARIYASPLSRTIQTIYPTAQKLGMQIELMPDLLEIGTHISGCSKEMLKKDFPLAVPCLSEPTQSGGRLVLPEFETAEMLTARAKRCIDYFKAKHSNGETIIAVSHGAFFSHLIRVALGAMQDDCFCCQTDNCACTVVAYRGEERKALLRSANNTAHLK